MIARLVALACAWPWRVLGLALALTLGAAWFAVGHIAMTTDATTLISPKVAWRQAEERMDRAFPANGDTLLVVIDGATPERAEEAAAALTSKLAADHAHFRNVSRPDGGDYLAREGLLLGSTESVTDTTQRSIDAQPFLGPLAADPSLRGIANALGTILQGVARGDASLTMIDTPLAGLSKALADRRAGRPAAFSWTELFGGDAPKRRLILTTPVLDYGSLMPGEGASAAARAAAAALRLDATHGVTVRITGSVPLSDEEFASLSDHAWEIGVAMLVAMLVTLRLATRSWRIVAAILMTTIAGLVVTSALGLAVVGRFNLISVAFIPLFVGLGVDFGIQLSVRFQHERLGADAAMAMRAAAAALGPSLLLAAGAVCLGFLAFLPTAYVGVAELGLIAAMGMAVALAMSLTLLPALLMLLDPGRPRAEIGSAAMAPLDALLHRRRRAVLALFGLSMLLSIAVLPLVRFDFNPLHLRNPDGEAMATLADLMRDPDRNPNVVDILVPNAAAAHTLQARLEKLPEVGGVITAETFVPKDQPAKLAVIDNARLLLDLTLNPIAPVPPPTDADTIAALRTTAAQLRAAPGKGAPLAHARALAAEFDTLAAASPGARLQAQDLLVRPLATTLDQLRAILTAGPVSLATLPAEIRDRWIAPDGSMRVEAMPRAGANDNRALAQFTRAVLKDAPDATGTAVSMQGAASTIAQAFVVAGILAFVVVSLLLLAVLRNVKEVAFTLAPVILSIFLTLGSCVLIGQPINFANIIAFPLLFGVGVAFHIYFVMAWRGGATDLLQSSLARAIFFSALATGSAFGSLWLSRHPGTASMGKILMISLVWTLVCALLFEPALLGPPQRKQS
ncbi:MMPL family transporter [Sphingomonas nostoxanthinifaciens]|uniref:MMPL family transporter n=1 Tax=Sphingomonas nostoxanthinifaciens TaxID=2872652 RepID=UPI001CC1E15F|nr:MMPL family transporter [Sphingomonas nostoxanthinifaciens]UAK23607.1 MMPL family transporter [Sphingomonas nostoxanthinifaciens]